MTLSRSTTPINEKRELRESVQELDKLLEDLKKAQVTDERSYSKRLNQESQFYNSTSSLNLPGSSAYRDSSATPPLRKLALTQKTYRDANDDDDVDYYAERLKSELNRDPDPIPRGVFVKDVVEEEILVDHVLIQPKSQTSDRKVITRPTERRQGEASRRQVGFVGIDVQETYDNTDTETDAENRNPISGRRVPSKQQDSNSASNLSLNSATTNLSETTDASSILDPNKVINCYTCGERVVGQVITALGRNYHTEHFTCTHCGQELGTGNFYEKEDLPYCERDYQALFSPKCYACGDPILDKVTIALDHSFHPEHFVCAHCGCQFDADDGFHEKDGKPYCKDDYFDLFANKCAGCNLPITANYITALSVQWHPDCFVCSDCHCPFGDGKFFDIDGAPYCEIHYHARQGSLCAVCRQPIIGKCTTAMFRKFHPDHFTCTYCLKVLTKSFKEENDKPYCYECFDKLYS